MAAIVQIQQWLAQAERTKNPDEQRYLVAAVQQTSSRPDLVNVFSIGVSSCLTLEMRRFRSFSLSPLSASRCLSHHSLPWCSDFSASAVWRPSVWLILADFSDVTREVLRRDVLVGELPDLETFKAAFADSRPVFELHSKT
ncbi:MAG: hypothetical protein LBB76_11530 [Azoarcus sp.]|nr:hypothetical protein [Azoarcus sp.]